MDRQWHLKNTVCSVVLVIHIPCNYRQHKKIYVDNSGDGTCLKLGEQLLNWGQNLGAQNVTFHNVRLKYWVRKYAPLRIRLHRSWYSSMQEQRLRDPYLSSCVASLNKSKQNKWKLFGSMGFKNFQFETHWNTIFEKSLIFLIFKWKPKLTSLWSLT